MKTVIILMLGLIIFLPLACGTTAATAPVKTAPDAANKMVNPWAGCGRGSFVHYKVARPVDGSTVEQKQVVVDVTPEQVLLETSTLVNNEWRSEGVLDFPLAPLTRPPAGKMKYSEQELKIGEQTLKCKVSEIEVQLGEAKTVIRNWMCRDIPGGFARKEMAGQTVWEVIDFARK